MNIYYIDCDREKVNSAGAKAPDDIAALCEMRGYNRFITPNFPNQKSKLYKKVWLLFNCKSWWKRLKKTVSDGDVVIYQHPSYGKSVAARMINEIRARKNVKFVAVIHDLESLRGGIQGVIEANTKLHSFGDNELLKCFDFIICHNSHMKEYMIGQGFDEKKLISLEIFDYLTDKDMVTVTKSDRPSVTIAGNLAKGKCGYIYDICGENHNKGLDLYLFGIRFDQESATENMLYQGSFKPEELPQYLKGDFGLVWDGYSAESCMGNTGEYLRYNNPHKTSLYLASGMPVVVWSKAAIADFILENKAGIVVDSLYELEESLSKVSAEEYSEMLRNAREIGKRLREGFYFYKAIDTCLS